MQNNVYESGWQSKKSNDVLYMKSNMNSIVKVKEFVRNYISLQEIV